MRRRVSFYPDSGRVEDQSEHPACWSETSDYEGVIDDDEMWREYEAACAALGEVERRLFEKIQSPAPFTAEERAAHDAAVARMRARHDAADEEDHGDP